MGITTEIEGGGGVSRDTRPNVGERIGGGILGSDICDERLNLLTKIESHSARGTSIEIVRAEGTERRTVSDLLDAADSCAADLWSVGIEPGARVGAVATTTFDFIVALLATWRVGCTFVPLPPPGLGDPSRWHLLLEARLRDAEVAVVVAGKDEGLPPVDAPLMRLGRTGAIAAPGLDLAAPSGQEQEAVIQFSSGTTGSARGVVLSHQALIAQLDALQARFGLSGSKGDHLVSWLPFNHDLGFISYLLRPLAAGVNLSLLPTRDFVRDPVQWFRSISKYERVHSAAPNFAFALVSGVLRKASRSDFDLSVWHHASVGGEPVDADVLSSFQDAAGRFRFDPFALSPGYGLAEAVCVVTVSEPNRPHRVDLVDRKVLSDGFAAIPQDSSAPGTARFVSVGVPLKGTEVSIDDGSGSPTPDRTIGEIRVRAPFLMTGYLNDPSATAHALADGWLRTGDLGYVHEGELFITGRSKDIVVVNGRNLHAEDVERLVHQVTGIRKGGVVAFSSLGGKTEALVIAAESPLSDQVERSRCRASIQRQVWRETGVTPERVVLLQPGSLPKTSSGKLQRHRAASLIRDGVLMDS